jgi:hypothetical protein
MTHTPTPTFRVANVAPGMFLMTNSSWSNLSKWDKTWATFSTLDVGVGVGVCVMQYTHSYKTA